MKTPYLLLLLVLMPLRGISCSAFFIDSQSKFFAKNFDWSSGEGYIIKNKIGQKKFAYGLRGTNQASWVSKYGSLTFNQIGKEFPYGGMNETGLVVEQLWMSESIYQDNNNSTISELEWIQYQLDNYASVEEVIGNINNLTIKPIATVHYFIADRKGASAVIDFIEGKTVINKKSGGHQVITNETFLSSEKYFSLNQANTDPTSRSNFDRYCQLKNSLTGAKMENADQAFDILARSSENRENYKTYWTIVYDLDKMKIHFKSLQNSTVKEVNMAGMDFKPSSATEASYINSDQFNLQPYSFALNNKQFKNSMKMMGLKIDESLGALHQMNPDQNRIDQTYQNNYIDLTINFVSKIPKGKIYYSLISGEENFQKRAGVKTGIISISKPLNKKVIYAMPKGEFALACFQDTDLDNRMDTRLFGIPRNYGFSRNNRGFFGTPPSYDEAKINLIQDQAITVKIK